MIDGDSAELIALGLALLFALAAPWLCPARIRSVHAVFMRRLGAAGRHPLVVSAVLGACTALLAAVHASYVHRPEPSVHDEFAYILGAETFASGSLAMPQHVHWEHFETFHVLHAPSYAPKYPPGQSLALAAGLELGGDIRVGLWLQCGLMVSALTWMLFGWVSPRWAVLGGIAALLQLGAVGPWVQTFYGGAVAATGGALLLGAVPRLVGRPSAGAGIGLGLVLGLGLSVLALTRPFEGLVASGPVCLWLLWKRALPLRVVISAAAVLCAAATFLALHNRAVTGNALRMPYMEYDAQYSMYPPFVWQPVVEPPAYRHAEIEEFSVGFQAGDYHRVESAGGALELALQRQGKLLRSLAGLLLLLPLVCLLFRRGEGWTWLPAGVWIAVSGGLAMTVFCAPHYAAPGAGALFILVMRGWRCAWHSRAKCGAARAAALTLAIASGLLFVACARAADRKAGDDRVFGQARASFERRLLRLSGDDLVLVNSVDGHSVHHEFVFNGAAIDTAPIVWARDMGKAGNSDLLRSFADRRIWSLRQGSFDDGDIELVEVTSEPRW